MNLDLTSELENLGTEKVASGPYNSASELVRDALPLLLEQDELRREIRRGTEASAQGRVKDGEAAIAAIRQELTRTKKR